MRTRNPVLRHQFYAMPCIVLTVAAALLFLLFGCTREGPTGSQGPPGQNGTPDGLSDPNIQPKIIFTSPANGSIGPFDLYDSGENNAKPHFVVRFNKRIYLNSVTSEAVKATGFSTAVKAVLYRPYTVSANSDVYDNILAFTIYDSIGLRKQNFQSHMESL